jgi:hypothetical protein
MLRLLKLFKMLTLLLAISSCTKVEIKDVPIYWDAAADGATLTHLLSDDVSQVPKAQWDAMRPGYACISEDDFGWVRASLEKLCALQKGICTVETKQVMRQFFARVDRLPKRKK